ncbi:hypothetical protein F5Y04DRAFT_258384 [Hypomontagnella monticulosa]|nr:hypothetical protein F5Y04DRAFT_258384 [Hypomontagnella monticulosa]
MPSLPTQPTAKMRFKTLLKGRWNSIKKHGNREKVSAAVPREPSIADGHEPVHPKLSHSRSQSVEIETSTPPPPIDIGLVFPNIENIEADVSPGVKTALVAWRESTRPLIALRKDEIIESLITETGNLSPHHNSREIVGNIVEELLTKQAEKDPQLSGKVKNLIPSVYPAITAILKLTAFEDDEASSTPLKITVNALIQVVSTAIDANSRSREILTTLETLSEHQQYVDKLLSDFAPSTFQLATIEQAVYFLTEMNNFLKVSLDYLDATHEKPVEGTLGDDEVQPSKTALEEASNRFRDAVQMEVDIIESRNREDVAALDALDSLTGQTYADIQSACRNTRTENTGKWLLDTPQFNAWLSGSTQVLLCSGVAGSGKTFLTSTVIDHLLNLQKTSSSSIAVAYAYCLYSDQKSQSVERILGSFSRQLIQHNPELLEKLRKFQDDNRGKKVGIRDYTNFLSSLLSSYSEGYIIIDAIDEASTSVQDMLFAELKVILNDRNCRLFLTSRPRDIKEGLPGFSEIIEVVPSKDDIFAYVDKRFYESSLHAGWSKKDPTLLQRVRDKVHEKSNGVFLLASFQMDQILEQESIGELKQVLDTMETNLDNVYKAALQRIEALPENLARPALNLIYWVHNVRTPLNIVEMRHALATDFRSVTSFETLDDFVRDVSPILNRCAGLVTIREPGIFTLAHETVNAYLKTQPLKYFEKADIMISQSCLRYLLLDELRDGPCTSDESFQARLEKLPFLTRAATYWTEFIQDITDAETENLAVEFLRHPGCLEAAMQAEHMHRLSQKYCENSQTYIKGMTGLHVAVKAKLPNLVRCLCEGKLDISAQTEDGNSPLHMAAKLGDNEIAALLLEAGAQYDIPNKDLVRTTISLSKDTSIRTYAFGATTYQCGVTTYRVSAKHLESVPPCGLKMMLEAGMTPLQLAVKYRHKETAELLLRKGADINICPASNVAFEMQDLGLTGHKISLDPAPGFTALQWAVYNGDREMTKMLLDKGADVNLAGTFNTLAFRFKNFKVEDSYHVITTDTINTPLGLALQGSDRRIIRMLRRKGARDSVKASPKVLELQLDDVHLKRGDLTIDLPLPTSPSGVNASQTSEQGSLLLGMQDINIENGEVDVSYRSHLLAGAATTHSTNPTLLLSQNALVCNDDGHCNIAVPGQVIAPPLTNIEQSDGRIDIRKTSAIAKELYAQVMGKEASVSPVAFVLTDDVTVHDGKFDLRVDDFRGVGRDVSVSMNKISIIDGGSLRVQLGSS